MKKNMFILGIMVLVLVGVVSAAEYTLTNCGSEAFDLSTSTVLARGAGGADFVYEEGYEFLDSGGSGNVYFYDDVGGDCTWTGGTATDYFYTGVGDFFCVRDIGAAQDYSLEVTATLPGSGCSSYVTLDVNPYPAGNPECDSTLSVSPCDVTSQLTLAAGDYYNKEIYAYENVFANYPNLANFYDSTIHVDVAYVQGMAMYNSDVIIDACSEGSMSLSIFGDYTITNNDIGCATQFRYDTTRYDDDPSTYENAIVFWLNGSASTYTVNENTIWYNGIGWWVDGSAVPYDLSKGAPLIAFGGTNLLNYVPPRTLLFDGVPGVESVDYTLYTDSAGYFQAEVYSFANWTITSDTIVTYCDDTLSVMPCVVPSAANLLLQPGTYIDVDITFDANSRNLYAELGETHFVGGSITFENQFDTVRFSGFPASTFNVDNIYHNGVGRATISLSDVASWSFNVVNPSDTLFAISESEYSDPVKVTTASLNGPLDGYFAKDEELIVSPYSITIDASSNPSLYEMTTVVLSFYDLNADAYETSVYHDCSIDSYYTETDLTENRTRINFVDVPSMVNAPGVWQVSTDVPTCGEEPVEDLGPSYSVGLPPGSTSGTPETQTRESIIQDVESVPEKAQLSEGARKAIVFGIFAYLAYSAFGSGGSASASNTLRRRRR